MKPSPPDRPARVPPTAPLQTLPCDSLGMDAAAFKRGVLGHLEHILAELPHQVDSKWQTENKLRLAATIARGAFSPGEPDLFRHDEAEWTRRSIVNVAHMGKFSSDRTIRQYAEEVRRVVPMKVE